MEKVLNIGKNCGAKNLILSDEFWKLIERDVKDIEGFIGLGQIQWIKTSQLNFETQILWQAPKLDSNPIAFLQYTSGSTSEPKGCVITHKNLLTHSVMVFESWGYELDKDILVSWLPPYHDMGLIGGIILPCVCLIRTVVMSPLGFIQNPKNWLKLITKYKATCSGGPNFAYQYCVSKISEDDIKNFDLSSLAVLFTGAEPINPLTLEAFTTKFAPSGFVSSQWYPCYGMAEATLLVTGGRRGDSPIILSIDNEEFLENRVRLGGSKRIVSVGSIINYQKLIVVNESHQLLNDLSIGEVLIEQSDHISFGYYKNEKLTSDMFHVQIGEKQYMKTGDLGFVYDTNLYICGRLKDLIIIRGRNLYPQDIESIIENCDPNLRKGCCAVFSITSQDSTDEKLIVVIEAKDKLHDDVFVTMRRLISQHFMVHLDEIVIIKPKSIDKTTSGKIRRFANKQLYQSKKLEILQRNTQAEMNRTISNETIQAQIKSILGFDLIPDIPFFDQGLDSLQMTQLIGELQKQTDLIISPTIFFEYPTLNQLILYLTGKIHKKSSHEPSSQPEQDSVAIVGISCRFPNSNGPEEFWDLLNSSNNGIGTHQDRQGMVGGFMKNPFDFDPQFFSISNREVQTMDPQQRILLELTQELLDDAGIKNAQLSPKTGVFIGSSTHDWSMLQSSQNVDIHSVTGSSSSILANRISYHYDLKGPSMVIDTACSSSLVALHLASESIKNGESSLTICGGANLVLIPEISKGLSKFLSPDGSCKVFDENANGYVRSEGVGLLLLKSFKEAVKDGNQIYGIIKSTGVMQDGKGNGLTAPNPNAQRELLEATWKKAGITGNDLFYLETHGTGTKLGDPIEVNTIHGLLDNRKYKLNIGSVKSNIGHLEAAAGMAGLIKVLLSMKHNQIPPNLHFDTPNSLINFEKVAVVNKGIPWNKDQKYAAISSFGFGGTISHMVLERYDSPTIQKTLETSIVISTSGSNKNQVLKSYQNIVSYSKTHPQVPLQDIAFSLLHRQGDVLTSFVICKDLKDLEEHVTKEQFSIIPRGQKVVFMFPGQGTDIFPSALEMYENDKTFALHFDQLCDKLIVPDMKNILKTKIDPNQLTISQPLQFLIQMTIAECWKSNNVVPDAVVGHSFGEISAACCSGYISLTNAYAMILLRSKLLERHCRGQGKMLISRMTKSDAQNIATTFGVEISVLNSAQSLVFSGPTSNIVDLQTYLTQNQISCKMLEIDYAFHSKSIELIKEEFMQFNLAPTKKLNQIKFYSSTLGKLVDQSQALKVDFWYSNVRNPVSFDQAVSRLDQSCFVEVSPKRVINWIPSLLGFDLGNLIHLHLTGRDVVKLNGKLVSVPTRVWNHKLFGLQKSSTLIPNEAQVNVDEIMIPFVIKAFENLLIDKKKDFTLNGVIQDFKISSKYEKLLAHLIHVLIKHGYVQSTSQGYIFTSKNIPTSLQVPQDYKTFIKCFESLDQVLTGKINPLELLFPDSSMDSVEHLYENSQNSIYYNQVIADFVSQKPNAKILEVGAGTGGLTTYLIDKASDYTFTDISKLFLIRAQEKFVKHSNKMKFAILNVEQDASQQGFEPIYDIIIAANVIHATQSLQESLKNLNSLLAPNGKLILLEVTKPNLFLDLTFGLLDGWWRFTDDRNYPLIAAEDWKKRMIATGFSQVSEISHSNGFQSILVATSDSLTPFTSSKKDLIAPTNIVMKLELTSTQIAHLQKIIKSNDSTLIQTEMEQIFVNILTQATLNESIHSKTIISTLGVDSLMAMEIRTLVSKHFDFKIPPWTDATTIQELVTIILTQMNPVKQDLTIVDLNDNFTLCKPCILSIGLATPKYCYQQSEMAELAKGFYKNERIDRIFNGSEIEQRYSVVNIHDPSILNTLGSFQKRNEIYEVEAVELADQSCQNALKNWGGKISDITHLVSVSTTGTKIPGIEFELVNRLGLSKSVQRVAVNYMGCFGSLPGLKTACAFASMNPKNRVLMVSTEICSTHFEEDPTVENIVSAAIFADGSGALVIGGGNFETFETPMYQIERFGSLAIDNSLDKMYWKVTDKGWKLGLSRDIPSLIHDHISNFVDSLVDHKDCDFALHPGGKAILLSIENAVGIKREKTQSSWNVMKKHGNMSSSSILYVLQDLLQHRTRETTCMLVFGPGLVIEGALLKNLYQK